MEIREKGENVEAVALIASCVLSATLSALIGKRFAKELADPIKGIGVVISLAGLISAIISFISVYTWIVPTAVSSTEQLLQVVYNSIQVPVAFVLNWLLSSLFSIPLAIASYVASYLASQYEELYYYSSIF